MKYNVYEGVMHEPKHWPKLIAAAFAALALSLVVTGFAFAAKPASNTKGFNEYGYNYNARVFVGTCQSWADSKVVTSGWSQAQADSYCGAYANDKLVMKWNAAWDACNEAGNADPEACTGATLTNEWNGMVPGGSGETEHFKAVWITAGSCGANYTPLADGGYCIWGHYEALMDQGMNADGHWVLAHATPNGFGVKP